MTNAGQMKIVLHSSCVMKREIIAGFVMEAFFNILDVGHDMLSCKYYHR